MFKTILIPIGNDEEIETRIKASVTMAKKFDAHVKALHVIPTLKSLEQLTPYAYYSYDLYTRIWETQKNKAAERKKHFLDYMKKNYDDYEWCQEEGDFMHYLKLASRSCDLTIVSQGEDTYTDIMGTMARFIMESSLPVLAVPSSGLDKDFGKNIMVAWDNSAQATRALHDAIPLLKMAENVTIVSISEKRKPKNTTEDICAMLARMGIEAKGLNEGEHYDRSERIMELAGKENINLIVAGAWGHKRITEVIFGGVTKTLFTNQDIPIFFSH